MVLVIQKQLVYTLFRNEMSGTSVRDRSLVELRNTVLVAFFSKPRRNRSQCMLITTQTEQKQLGR